MEKDPICGMTVDPKRAAGSATYAGKAYYFCSAGCKATFEKNPARYAK
ncbi:MAG TPA: YHS domain-containing protein [Thermoplasmata archaeon]|jgi:Cu+-exporting ATPase|nr:YHS domain-containing protein [Thermoplasmata archaeon]